MLILEEHFQDNRHKWYVHDSVECTTHLGINHYFFEHRRSGNSSWLVWNSTNFSNFYAESNFRIHIALEKVGGVLNQGYGFVWQLSDTRNFFEFIISDSQFYQIVKHQNGNQTNCTPWRPCPAIRRPNTLNILEICRDGAILEFYINSTLVEKLLVDSSLRGKQFGFVIYDKIKIKVHSLIISTASTETPPRQSNSSSNAAMRATFLEHEPPAEDSLEKIFADLNALVGHRQMKQQLSSLVSFLNVQSERKARNLKTVETSLHLVLCGPPGTGKTTIARLIGRLYRQLARLQRGQVVEVDRAGLVGGYIGQTALRVEDAVNQALGGVLFVDEAYALAPKGGSSNDFGLEALQILLKRMEDYRDQLAVIVAGYTDEMEHFIRANPGLQSRFSRFVYLEHYRPTELILIFKKFCQDNGYAIDLSAHLALQTIFETAYTKRDKQFGNGRFARNLFEHSIEQQASRIADNVKNVDDTTIALIRAEDLWLAES
ncbi:AAA family ATPase [Phormidium tenue FACHB-886]|nr:AAA family ATPase [Phormidium tenue FACHB-886]